MRICTSLGIDTCSQGISLSGGQKQRINICRAIYVGADIQIFDDPISALDAHVGKHVFQNVFLGAAQDKTRILVTHALHFLPQVDYIYTMVDGRVAEHGTYADLMAANGDFARFVNEFVSKESELEKEEEAVAAAEKTDANGSAASNGSANGNGAANGNGHA